MSQVIFNRKLYKHKITKSWQSFKKYSFLHEESSIFLSSLISDFTKEFKQCFVYGYCPALLKLSNCQNIIKANIDSKLFLEDWPLDIVIDEEEINLKQNQFDLIVSNLSLHFVNNLQKTLIGYLSALKSKGLFLATIIGGESLLELRQACANTDIKLYGGIFPRVAPMVSLESACHLMSKSGFEMPISQKFSILLEHSNFLNLIDDLHGAGFGNFLINQSNKFPGKKFLPTLAQEYEKLCLNGDKLLTKLEILVMTGSKS